MSRQDELSIMALIDSMANQFTKTDWTIAQFIKKHADAFSSMTAAELAAEIGTSDASIVRFAQKVGFDGLNEMRAVIKREISSSESESHDERGQLESQYQESIASLFQLAREEDLQLFDTLVHQSAFVQVCAFKQNSCLANLIVDKLMLLGIKVTAITNMNEFQLCVARANRDDLFIVLDIGADQDRLERQFDLLDLRETPVVLLTRYLKSNLREKSALSFLIPASSDPLSGAALSESTLTLILSDILFSSLLESNSARYKDFLARSLDIIERRP